MVECEISREKVPLRNAYKHVGQRASLRVNSGSVVEATPASPPFPQVRYRTVRFSAVQCDAVQLGVRRR